jgi:hypothetical protein
MSRSFPQMLRVLFVSTILLAMPGPALADDMDTCACRKSKAGILVM